MVTVSTIETTPSARSDHRRRACEGRVTKVCPHPGRCLVTNSSSTIQYCHLVPRWLWKDEALMTRLEWYWGLHRGTLNLDTRWNVFPCFSTLHIKLETGGWALLPTDEVINQYHQSLTHTHGFSYAERRKHPQIPNGNFMYRFLPIRSMDDILISRQIRIPLPGHPVRKEDFIHHAPPFDGLPQLESHIHPKFAIFHLGRQLSVLSGDEISVLVNVHPSLSRVLDVYNAWCRPTPDAALQDTEFNAPLEDLYDDDGSDDEDDVDDAKDRSCSGSTIPRREGKRKANGPRLADGPGAAVSITFKKIRSSVPSVPKSQLVEEWAAAIRPSAPDVDME